MFDVSEIRELAFEYGHGYNYFDSKTMPTQLVLFGEDILSGRPDAAQISLTERLSDEHPLLCYYVPPTIDERTPLVRDKAQRLSALAEVRPIFAQRKLDELQSCFTKTLDEFLTEEVLEVFAKSCLSNFCGQYLKDVAWAESRPVIGIVPSEFSTPDSLLHDQLRCNGRVPDNRPVSYATILQDPLISRRLLRNSSFFSYAIDGLE